MVFQNGSKKDFIVDTGSPITFLPIRDLQQLGIKKSTIQPSSTEIEGVSGHTLPVIGEVCQLIQSVPGAPVHLNLVITNLLGLDQPNNPAVLGLDGLRALQVEVALETSTKTITEPLERPIQELQQQQSLPAAATAKAECKFPQLISKSPANQSS